MNINRQIFINQLIFYYHFVDSVSDFATNAGYGTAKHLEGLEKLGVTPIHRTSFEPVKSLVSGEKES